jgi:hypothetical protein
MAVEERVHEAACLGAVLKGHSEMCAGAGGEPRGIAPVVPGEGKDLEIFWRYQWGIIPAGGAPTLFEGLMGYHKFELVAFYIFDEASWVPGTEGESMGCVVVVGEKF